MSVRFVSPQFECPLNFRSNGVPVVFRWDPIIRKVTVFGVNNTSIDVQLPRSGPNTVCGIGLWVPYDIILDIMCDW